MPSTPTRGEYDGAPKSRTTPRKPGRSTPGRTTPSVSSYMDAASRASGSEAYTAATPPTAPPKRRKGKKVREAARSDRSAGMSVTSTEDESVIDMIPGEAGRCVAWYQLVYYNVHMFWYELV